MEPLDVLAFSAHPDDAEIGCGGALALAAREGLRVGVADLTEGERASRGTPGRRSRERAVATRTLGLGQRIAGDLPDGDLPRSREALVRVVDLLRHTKPHTVLAPHEADRHPDHEAASRLVREGCFAAGVAAIGEGSPHRPARLFSYMVHSPFDPSFVVDISDVWKQKKAAVMSYRSQFSDDGEGPATALSGGDFLEFLEVRARWFGAMIGARYGEPYAARGPVPLARLPETRRSGDPATPLEYSMW